MKTLSAWCKEYGLPSSGKKELLKARLTAFSENKEQWDMYVTSSLCLLLPTDPEYAL